MESMASFYLRAHKLVHKYSLCYNICDPLFLYPKILSTKQIKALRVYFSYVLYI